MVNGEWSMVNGQSYTINWTLPFSKRKIQNLPAGRA